MSISLTTLGVGYTQNFDSLSNTAGSTTNVLMIPGWVLNETGGGARDNEQFAVDTGASNTGDTFSYGTAGSNDRALGALQSGTLISNFGASFTNNTGSAITSLLLAYTGEQWRLGTVARADRLDFQYSLTATSITTGTWIDADSFDFSTPTQTGTTGALDGNAAANRTAISGTISSLNIANGATFWVRWQDFNASGADDGLAIDDFSLTAQGSSEPAPTIAIAPTTVSQAEGNSGTTAFTHTITRSDTAADTSVQVTIAGSGANPINAADIASVTVDGTPVAGFALGTAFTVTLTGAATIANIVVSINGDTTTEPDETFTVTLSAPTAGYTLGAATATDTVTNDDIVVPTVTHQIGELQGATHQSSFVTALNTAGTTIVTTEGIVTARDTDGFYIQDDTPDANILTSDGIFVFTGTTPTVTVGNRVVVTGEVFEFQQFNNLPQTQIVGSASSGSTRVGVATSDIVVTGVGQPLPFQEIGGTATGRLIPALTATNSDDFNGGLANIFNLDANGRPLDGTDFWETTESMRVIYNDAVVADGFWYSFNGFYVYSSSIGATSVNARGGITMSGGTSYDPAVGVAGGGATVIAGDLNPERIQVDFSESWNPGFASLNTEIDMGDQLNGIVGIVKLDFTNWKLFATETPTFKSGGNQPTGPIVEVTNLTADARQLKVSSFNVENLDPLDDTTLDEGATGGTGKFNDLARQFNTNLKAPDIILVSEVQDNNGPGGAPTTNVDASLTWTRLTQAIRTETGKNYVWVDEQPVANVEGGEQTGNIRVGFIYDADKIQLGKGAFVEAAFSGYGAGATQTQVDAAAAANLAAAVDRRVWTDRIGDGVRDAGDQISFSDNMLGPDANVASFNNTRKSLIGEFSFNGQQIFAVANHWPSKGGSGAQYFFNPANLAADGANGGWAARKGIAEAIWNSGNYIKNTLNLTDSKFIVGGDLNEYWFYDPLRVIEGYIDETGAVRGAGEYKLTNLITTLPVEERFTYTFDGNSQTLDHLVYEQSLVPYTTFDSVHVSVGYNSVRANPTDRALSDHEPVLAVTDFRPFAEILNGAGGADVIEGLGGNDTINGGLNNDDVYGGAGADSMIGGGGFDFLRYETATAGVNAIINGTGTGGEAAGDVSSGFEGLTGSQFDDTLTGSSALDVIYGRGGADRIIGGGTADWLQGDGGADVFVYLSATDSTAASSDYIADFSTAQGDKIDLSAITGGAATFNSGFGTGLSVYAINQSAWGLVQVYNGAALQMQIVTSQASLAQTDFVL